MPYKLSLKDLQLFSLKKKKTETGHDKSIQMCKRLLKEVSNKLLSLFTCSRKRLKMLLGDLRTDTTENFLNIKGLLFSNIKSAKHCS